MEHCAPRSEAADYIGISEHMCPKCQGHLIRTPRRPTDRLLSLFKPVQRYRCARFSCQWVGNLAVKHLGV